MKDLPLRTNLFKGVSGSDCLALLRTRLAKTGTPFALSYETKDFRRGDARDLVRKPGSTLREVMDMGQWKSHACQAYLDVDEIEAEAIIEAHILESDSDEESAGNVVDVSAQVQL